MNHPFPPAHPPPPPVPERFVAPPAPPAHPIDSTLRFVIMFAKIVINHPVEPEPPPPPPLLLPPLPPPPPPEPPVGAISWRVIVEPIRSYRL